MTINTAKNRNFRRAKNRNFRRTPVAGCLQVTTCGISAPASQPGGRWAARLPASRSGLVADHTGRLVRDKGPCRAPMMLERVSNGRQMGVKWPASPREHAARLPARRPGRVAFPRERPGRTPAGRPAGPLAVAAGRSQPLSRSRWAGHACPPEALRLPVSRPGGRVEAGPDEDDGTRQAQTTPPQ